MKKTINISRLVQGLIELTAAFAFFWLAITRCYQYYVTPRTLPYLYFAGVMFLAMGVYNLFKLRELTHTHRYMHLLALVIPLAILGASAYAQGLLETPIFPGNHDNDFNNPKYLDEVYTMQTPVYAGRELHGYDEENQTITIMEAETYQWLVEIYNDPTPFLGYTIRTMGQVLTESDRLSYGCFSPTRKLMTCCVADMFIIGFACQYNSIETLHDGDWVSVTGTLTMVDMEEYQELRILVDTIDESPLPDEPYVYSY